MSAPASLLQTDAEFAALLRGSRRIAVIGIKPESLSHQPAHYVPEYLQRAGYELIPVPVYYPEAQTILGLPVQRSLRDITGTIDIAVLFRRPADIPAHLPELLALCPRAVWMQSGIRHEEAARSLTAQGIAVVQDRCIMVEHRKLATSP